jgi:hypothetical protein
MTSHSNKMERQCIFTSQFGQDLPDLNFPSKSTGKGGRIAWPPRSPDPTTLEFFILDTQRILFTFHHFSLTLMLQIDARMRATAATDAPAVCTGMTCAVLRTVPPAYPYQV